MGRKRVIESVMSLPKAASCAVDVVANRYLHVRYAADDLPVRRISFFKWLRYLDCCRFLHSENIPNFSEIYISVEGNIGAGENTSSTVKSSITTGQ